MRARDAAGAGARARSLKSDSRDKNAPVNKHTFRVFVLGGVGATPLPFNVRVNGFISFPRQPRMAAWQSKDHQ